MRRTDLLGGTSIGTTARKKPNITWKAAKDLKVGDQIVLEDGTHATLEKITPQKGVQTVYNIAVDQDHTYFVGEMGIWAHNRYGAAETDAKPTVALTPEERQANIESATEILNDAAKGIVDVEQKLDTARKSLLVQTFATSVDSMGGLLKGENLTSGALALGLPQPMRELQEEIAALEFQRSALSASVQKQALALELAGASSTERTIVWDGLHAALSDSGLDSAISKGIVLTFDHAFGLAPYVVDNLVPGSGDFANVMASTPADFQGDVRLYTALQLGSAAYGFDNGDNGAIAGVFNGVPQTELAEVIFGNMDASGLGENIAAANNLFTKSKSSTYTDFHGNAPVEITTLQNISPFMTAAYQQRIDQYNLKEAGKEAGLFILEALIEPTKFGGIAKNLFRVGKGMLGAKALRSLGFVDNTVVQSGRVASGTLKAVTRACFAAGTMILTKNGLKPIESIQVGDLVWSRSEHNVGEPTWRKVTEWACTGESEIWEVKVTDAFTTETYRTTELHPFWIDDDRAGEAGGFCAAADLKTGDPLKLHDGGVAYVESVRRTNNLEPVYNFSVEGFHTYHVGELGVWVHNRCKYETIIDNVVIDGIEVNGVRTLTDGVYTVRPGTGRGGMGNHIHTSSRVGASVFLPDVDAYRLVLDAAEIADKQGLWLLNNGAKAKVTMNDYIGRLGTNDQLTKVVNIYRDTNNIIHGSPGN